MIELKNKIVALCNESGLPLEAVMFVLKDLFRDAELNLKILEQKEKENIKQEEEENGE